MEVRIRKGLKKDLPMVLDLIKELAGYENATDKVDIILEDLEKDGFGINPLFKFIVAENQDDLIGMSLYFVRYSTWKGKTLYIEDFIIKKQYRGFGVGSLLFQEMIAICVKEEFKGMTWQVLDWNLKAINFYKKYDAEISSSWLDGKLTKEQIHKFYSKNNLQ